MVESSEYNIEDMDVGFIRHKLTWETPSLLRKFWNEGLIGIRCHGDCDTESQNPEDHNEKCEKRIQTLREWRRLEDPLLVVADYRSKVDELIEETGDEELYSFKTHIRMGILPPESEITREDYGEESRLFRVMELVKPKEISQADYPVFWSSSPTRGTICYLGTLKSQAKAAYSGNPLPEKVSSLTDRQLESLCAEYLRSGEINITKMKHTVLPVGRPDNYDVIGILENGENIFAEVTRSSNEINEKLNLLKKATDEEDADDFVLFGPDNSNIIDPRNIEYVSIKDAFYFYKDTMLMRRMLGK